MGMFGVESIKTCFWHCNGLSEEGGAREAIAMLQQVGGEFLNPMDMQLHPDPYKEIDAQGKIGIDRLFRHPALQMDSRTLYEISRLGLPEDTKPVGQFGFIQEIRYYTVYQDVILPDRNPQLVDRVAWGS